MNNFYMTRDEILGYVSRQFERSVIEKHDARCVDRAATMAEENGASFEESWMWAAAYLDGGDVECTCEETS